VGLHPFNSHYCERYTYTRAQALLIDVINNTTCNKHLASCVASTSNREPIIVIGFSYPQESNKQRIKRLLKAEDECDDARSDVLAINRTPK
jgi:hypothetical protein